MLYVDGHRKSASFKGYAEDACGRAVECVNFGILSAMAHAVQGGRRYQAVI